MKRHELETKIERLKRELELAQNELATFERSCTHAWGQSVSDNIYEAAYTIPGDEPGTMGVDYRGPCHVPSKTTLRWKRTCSKCGKVEHTTNTNAVTTHTPQF